MFHGQHYPTAQPVASNSAITNQSSSVNQVYSNTFLCPSLNVLTECEGASLEMSDQNPNNIIISSSETGDRLFNATYEYREYGFGEDAIIVIQAIILYDFMGHEFLRTTWQNVPGSLLYHINASGQNIGTFIQNSCYASAHHVSSNYNPLGQFDFVPDEDFCCPCAISKFKILQTTPNEQAGENAVGEMSGLPENPDLFRVKFPKSLSVVDKTLFLVSGVILNLNYYAKQKYCGCQCRCHVGERGCCCMRAWIALSVVCVMSVLVVVIPVLVFREK